MPSDNKDFWFAPKTFGYGSGMPTRWQGWALLAAHLGAIAAAGPLADSRPGLFTGYAVFVTLILLPVYAAKTEGGWSWRWGGGRKG